VKNFLTPVIVGVMVLGALFPRGVHHGMALLTFGLSAFVMTIIIVEFVKGTKARARIEGEGHLLAFYHLVSRNRRRWGGYIVHVGVVMIFTAFAGVAFNREVVQILDPGETITIESPFGHEYALTYQGLSSPRGQNMLRQAVALMTVERDGRPVESLTAEKVLYFKWEQSPITNVGVNSYILEDLYLILDNVNDLGGAFENDAGAQRATFKVQVNVLVGWIWYGGFVVTLGGIIAMWPSRGSTTTVSRSKTKTGGERPALAARS
jgi:cytochrome c-type biogenesis protein CcmF